MPVAKAVVIPVSFNKVNQYWEGLKPKSNIKEDVARVWIEKVKFLDEISTQNKVVIFLWNNFTNRFLYMSDKVKILSGMDPELYMSENGVHFSLDRIHPAQLPVAMAFNQQGLKFIETHGTKDVKDIVVSMSFLYRNAINEYVPLVQQTSALDVDENGRPSLFISFVHYTGHIKKSNAVDYTISTPDAIYFYNYNHARKELEPAYTFSAQEKKVIQLLAMGLDTKTIAQKLFISTHTVATHRRNLIKKTNCTDSTGVVAFARLINLI